MVMRKGLCLRIPLYPYHSANIFSHTRVQSGRWERLTYFGPGELREVNFEALVPHELDDEHILKDRILDPVSSTPVPHGTLSTAGQQPQDPVPAAPPFTLASGFNLHSRVFLKGLRESIATVGCECELRRGPAARLARMRELLLEMRYMLDDAPGPVRQWASSEEQQQQQQQRHDAVPTTPRYDNSNDDHTSVVSSYGGSPVSARRGQTGEGAPYSKLVQGQHEIMRANIHVTHLWLQSLLLERVDVIVQESVVGGGGTGVPAAAGAGADEVSTALKANWAEREDICRQMLHLLHSIPYVYLEPNGLYLVCPYVYPTKSWRSVRPFHCSTTNSFSRTGIQGPRRGRDAAQLPLRGTHAARPPRRRVHARLHPRPLAPRPQRDGQHKQPAELGRRRPRARRPPLAPVPAARRAAAAVVPPAQPRRCCC